MRDDQVAQDEAGRLHQHGHGKLEWRQAHVIDEDEGQERREAVKAGKGQPQEQ